MEKNTYVDTVVADLSEKIYGRLKRIRQDNTDDISYGLIKYSDLNTLSTAQKTTKLVPLTAKVHLTDELLLSTDTELLSEVEDSLIKSIVDKINDLVVNGYKEGDIEYFEALGEATETIEGQFNEGMITNYVDKNPTNTRPNLILYPTTKIKDLMSEVGSTVKITDSNLMFVDGAMNVGGVPIILTDSTVIDDVLLINTEHSYNVYLYTEENNTIKIKKNPLSGYNEVTLTVYCTGINGDIEYTKRVNAEYVANGGEEKVETDVTFKFLDSEDQKEFREPITVKSYVGEKLKLNEKEYLIEGQEVLNKDMINGSNKVKKNETRTLLCKRELVELNVNYYSYGSKLFLEFENKEVNQVSKKVGDSLVFDDLVNGVFLNENGVHNNGFNITEVSGIKNGEEITKYSSLKEINVTVVNIGSTYMFYPSVIDSALTRSIVKEELNPISKPNRFLVGSESYVSKVYNEIIDVKKNKIIESLDSMSMGSSLFCGIMSKIESENDEILKANLNIDSYFFNNDSNSIVSKIHKKEFNGKTYNGILLNAKNYVKNNPYKLSAVIFDENECRNLVVSHEFNGKELIQTTREKTSLVKTNDIYYNLHEYFDSVLIEDEKYNPKSIKGKTTKIIEQEDGEYIIEDYITITYEKDYNYVPAVSATGDIATASAKRKVVKIVPRLVVGDNVVDIEGQKIRSRRLVMGEEFFVIPDNIEGYTPITEKIWSRCSFDSEDTEQEVLYIKNEEVEDEVAE